MHAHMCNVMWNAATIILSANRVGDSFRIVNYAIMFDLATILSHCTLLHICQSPPCPLPYCHSTQDGFKYSSDFSKWTKYRKWTGVDGQHIFQISSTVTTRCCHWLVCKVDKSTRVNELAARTWDSKWELGSSKTAGYPSIYHCMQPSKWPPRKNYVVLCLDTG